MKSHLLKLCACLLLAAFPRLANAAVQTFGPGSFIIPMDSGANGQDNGMLTAYGLVHELLRHNVPVNWAINPAKLQNGDDFTIGASGALQDVRTGASLAPRSYRGGPFVIAAADAPAALPVILAWQAEPGDQTAVHRLVAGGAISVDVARTLVTAPRVAVLKDGNEAVAFNYLNAAGILDSLGELWSLNSPDLLTEAEVAGPSTVNHADGVLFTAPGGLPRYTYLAAMHYIATALSPEVVQEVRSWLAASPLTHALMQCEAARLFENDAAGRFLTTQGIFDDGVAPTAPVVRAPADPLAQIDGAFQVDSGAFDSIGLASGSFQPGVASIINQSGPTLNQRITLLSGRMGGSATAGRVTYLAGHDYAVELPVSLHPQTNGVRLFLNSILASDGALGVSQPDVVLTVSAPEFINGNEITYTINFTNPGPRPVENIELVDMLPANAPVISVSNGGTITGGMVTWNLPPLAAGASGSVSLTVNATADGAYTNSAVMSFTHLTERQVSSAPVTTTRDTQAPVITILATPPTLSNNTQPSFQFTVSGSPVATLVSVDGMTYPTLQPDPLGNYSFTVPIALTDGIHAFEVRTFDAVGNTASATYSFTVDTVLPIVTIPGPPINPTTFGTSTPQIFFTVNEAGAVTLCSLDGGQFAFGASPFTTVPLAPGQHTLAVFAMDAAGNNGPVTTFTFTVVNAAPTAANLSAPETYVEDVTLNLVNIVVSDSDSANVTATLTLSNTAAGSLSTGTSGAVTSTYSGGVWTASGPVANVNDLLAAVSFIPSPDFSASFTIATRVSDGVAPAIAGTKAMVGVAVNDPPTSTAPAAAITTQGTPLMFAGGNLLSVADVDSSFITVTLSATNGTLTVGTLTGLSFIQGDGTNDAVMSFSGTVANLNAALASLTYTPAAGYTGASTFTFSTTDSVSSPVVKSIGISITANHAPVLNASKSPVLNAQTRNAGAPVGAVGTLVSSLVDFALPVGGIDNVTDADGGALGIAVTAADTTNGAWFYSTNNGATWNPLGAVCATSARLLAADANTRLYFQPKSNFLGTVANAIAFRAWDRTSGSNGVVASPATNGGATAFSSTTDTASLSVTPAVLVSIEVSPANPRIPASRSQQFTATGTFSDGSRQDLTASATWSSTNLSVARISNANGSTGLATGLAAGTTQITARLGSVLGSTTLTVTSAFLVSIDLTPVNPSVTAGGTQQFSAIGRYSDGSTLNLTDSVTWSSSKPAVATISNATGSKGLATVLAAGTTQITASLGAASASTTLTGTAPIPTGGKGCFVIGDLDAVVGARVYFWGSQWEKKNHLSQGISPASFKGWANSIGGPNPIIGGVWKSDSGNSCQPPNSLPSLITVVATSSTAKSGCVISGNNKKIVVIRPDPGYGPNLGREGTGTVLSVSAQ